MAVNKTEKSVEDARSPAMLPGTVTTPRRPIDSMRQSLHRGMSGSPPLGVIALPRTNFSPVISRSFSLRLQRSRKSSMTSECPDTPSNIEQASILRSARVFSKLSSHFNGSGSSSGSMDNAVACLDSSETTEVFYDCVEYMEDQPMSPLPRIHTMLNLSSCTSESRPLKIHEDEIIATSTSSDTTALESSQKMITDQQIKLERTEAELEDCKRILEATESQIALAKDKDAKLEEFVSSFTRSLRQTHRCMTIHTTLSSSDFNLDGESTTHLESSGYTEDDNDLPVVSAGIDVGLMDSITDLRSAWQSIRGLAKALQKENADLMRRLETSDLACTNAIIQVDARDTEITKVKAELATQNNLTYTEQQKMEALEQELKLLKRDCIDKEPLVKIGAAIRLRFLEQSKIQIREVSRESLDQVIIQAGNAAAHDVNLSADIATLKLDFCGTADIKAIFFEMYRGKPEEFALCKQIVCRAFELQATMLVQIGYYGMPNLHKRIHGVIREIMEFAKQETLENTLEGRRLLARVESIGNEIFEYKARNARRRQ
ncbi:hypothetical protein VTL71DRAFT_8635 [Oculimacula yallundae]|uniref:Uncharacterized protein n=1 Tax=Oculimacula yallundae TaxID=86028 RepID=A0ABR4CZB7_9HELO